MDHVVSRYVKHGVRRGTDKSVIKRKSNTVRRRQMRVYYIAIKLVRMAQGGE